MIQVIQRALNVLSHLSKAGDQPCILGDIARAAGLNPATCSRILGTLMSEGYVEQDGPRKGYRLGPMAYVLTARGPYRKDLVTCAEPVVRHLAETTGETSLVAVLNHNARYTICQVDGSQDVQVRSDAVLRGDVYTTATGRLLLAHLADNALDAFLDATGLPNCQAWPEATTRKSLEKELASIRDEAVLIQHADMQIAGLSCAIRSSGSVVAALGLYLPDSRFTGTHKTTILKEMKAAAAEIGRRMSQMHERPLQRR